MAHLMHVTDWSYQQIMATPQTILSGYLLVKKVDYNYRQEKAAWERAMSESGG